MRPLPNSNAFDWIQRGRKAMPDVMANEAVGVEAACVTPAVFQRYVKIFHRLDLRPEDKHAFLTADEIVILGIPECSIVREFFLRQKAESIDSRVRWKDAADALGVPYAPGLTHEWYSRRLKPNPQCWSRFIYGPEDGTLDAEQCKELVSLLAEATPKQDCYFRFAEIPFVATDQELLFTGRLDDVEGSFLNGGIQSIYGRPFQFTPEYWWPEDHSWCVCSDYDLTFTVVGGPSGLIATLLSQTILECIEITPETRVDDLAPMPPNV